MANDDSIDDGRFLAHSTEVKVGNTRRRADGKDFGDKQQGLSSMARPPRYLGPYVSYLTAHKSTNATFQHLVSYRRYRLINTTIWASDWDLGMLGKWQRNMYHTMKLLTFTGDDPVAIIHWLSTYVNCCNMEIIPEVAAMSLAPNFLAGQAEKRYNSTRGHHRYGFNTWPERAIISYGCTYPTGSCTKRYSAFVASSSSQPSPFRNTMLVSWTRFTYFLVSLKIRRESPSFVIHSTRPCRQVGTN